MNSQRNVVLHNAIRNMDIEKLTHALELNGLSDCCDAIRIRQIDGDAFLNLNEGQLMFWRNILNRTQITRLWSVIQLAKERPYDFIQLDTTQSSSYKYKPNRETDTSKKPDKIASPIAGSLNTILAQQLTHQTPENFNNNVDFNQANFTYDVPPVGRPISYPSNSNESPKLKLPPKPALFNPPTQLPLLPSEETPPLIITQSDTSLGPGKTGQIPPQQQSDISNHPPPRPPPLSSNLANRPLPEPPKLIPILPTDTITLSATISNESTLDSLRKLQKDKSPIRNLNDSVTISQQQIENANQFINTITRKLPTPINPATRPLPEPPKEASPFIPRTNTTPKQNVAPAFNNQDELSEYDYVEQTIVDFTKERWYKEVDRKGAKALLRGRPDGSFIIRPSNKSSNVCSISINCQGRIYNLAVSYKEGQLVLGKTSFNSVQEIVQHFTDIPLVLTSPTGKDILLTLKQI